MIHSLPAGPLLEHELLRGVDGPVVPLARPAKRLGQLDEALVEGEIVAHRVLPPLVRTAEEWELLLKDEKIVRGDTVVKVL